MASGDEEEGREEATPHAFSRRVQVLFSAAALASSAAVVYRRHLARFSEGKWTKEEGRGSFQTFCMMNLASATQRICGIILLLLDVSSVEQHNPVTQVS